VLTTLLRADGGTASVLFLDEPTTGLDPRSRLAMWEVIESLVSEGTTVLLTTQYLDEADRLADMIAVVDHGLVIAQAPRTSSRTASAASGSRSRSRTARRSRTRCGRCRRWRRTRRRAMAPS